MLQKQSFSKLSDVLELSRSAYGASSKWALKKNADGSLKMESLRYQAYRSFLSICALRGLGKSRRCAMPACVVFKIRELYPADSGLYNVNFILQIQACTRNSKKETITHNFILQIQACTRNSKKETITHRFN